MSDWKTIAIVILTAIFVGCYIIALFGWAAFATNENVLGHVGPIVAVIIGYFFGRLPGEKNEANLRQDVEQARDAQTTAEKTASSLAQKVNDAATALGAGAPAVPTNQLATTLSEGGGDNDAIRHAAVSALKILQSA